MVKHFSNDQIDGIIRMKFGRMVASQFHTSYLSNAILGKLFKCSGSHIRQLYLRRFREMAVRQPEQNSESAEQSAS